MSQVTNQKTNKKVREPKKAVRAIEHLHSLVDQLRFFYHDNSRFKTEVLEKGIYIEDVLRELSVDKKVDHARFISRFKNLFGKEVEELKCEVEDLKEELKERGEKIQELVEENKELVEYVVLEHEGNKDDA